MDILGIALIVLVLAGVWLIVEAALAVRSARGAISEVRCAAEKAGPAIERIDQTVAAVEPVIEKIDQAVAQAQPAIAGVDPLLERTTLAVEALSGDLNRLDDILRDVSRISGTAGNATVVVSDAANSIAGKARSLFSRSGSSRQAQRMAQPTRATELVESVVANDADDAPATALEPEVQPDVTNKDRGYFTYPED